MKKIRVNVTAKDIKLGASGVHTRCPIARAMKRTIGKTVSVTNYSITENNIDNWPVVCSLTNRAIRFVRDFDHDKKVKPTKFMFEYYHKGLK